MTDSSLSNLSEIKFCVSQRPATNRVARVSDPVPNSDLISLFINQELIT